MTFSSFLSSCVLALGISGGLIGMGFLTENAVIKAKQAERFVTVKGIAERNVNANLGIWEIDYREVGDNLANLSAKMAQNQTIVMNFLLAHGFNASELELRPARVNDTLANPYNPPANPQAQNSRYILTGGIRIRTTNVEQIQKTSQLTGDLIKEGIPLSFDTSDYATDLSPNPSYFYTGLDAVRPEMLAEATKSARSVAEQFAKDSHSRLGDIRRANQGLFQISSRDGGSADGNANMAETRSITKKVRLVTTIDYYLN